MISYYSKHPPQMLALGTVPSHTVESTVTYVLIHTLLIVYLVILTELVNLYLPSRFQFVKPVLVPYNI